MASKLLPLKTIDLDIFGRRLHCRRCTRTASPLPTENMPTVLFLEKIYHRSSCLVAGLLGRNHLQPCVTLLEDGPCGFWQRCTEWREEDFVCGKMVDLIASACEYGLRAVCSVLVVEAVLLVKSDSECDRKISYGLYSYGLYRYGLYSYGRVRVRSQCKLWPVYLWST